MTIKKIFLLTLFFVLSKVSYCDIIPDNSHSVDKCVKIINSGDFPDISLVTLVRHPGRDGSKASILDPTLCIDKGYKFNILEIFAVKNSYLVNKNLDSIDWVNNTNCFRANIQIDSYGGYVDNATPISSIDEYYKIAGFTDTSVILYKCKEIIKFNNRRPVSIKTYTYKSGITSLDEQNSTKDDLLSGDNYSACIVFDFLKALLLTILIETIVLFVFFKTKFRTLNVKNKLLLLTGFIASFSTLPYVWFVLPIFIQPTFLYVLISELSVTFIESFIICSILKVNYKKSIIISVACNLTSFLIGLLATYI